jgi:hypothetical protein
MKKPFKPVTFTLILLLLVTASIHSQTTYDLPSGQSLLVINQLPETFRQHFNDEVLVDRLGDLPKADYRAIVAPGPDGLKFGLMLPSFDSEEFRDHFSITPGQSINRLDVELVVMYGRALFYWINDAQRNAPSDVSQAFRSVPWNAFIIFQKPDEMLMFQGLLDNSGGRSSFRIMLQQPITYQNTALGEYRIFTEGYEKLMLRSQETFKYPLPKPRAEDPTPSVSFVYDFFGIPID